MGGLMIIASIIVTSLIYVKIIRRLFRFSLCVVGFGVIGFLDDYLKVVLRRSDGLLAWQKMLCQLVVTTVFCGIHGEVFQMFPLRCCFHFPVENTGILAGLQFRSCILRVIGTVNGVNFTDGLDGLATSVTVL